MSAPEPVLIKFAKTIYESPLILLLCGSAVVSAFMGNIDDAVSITVAVLIVLTGASELLLWHGVYAPLCPLSLSNAVRTAQWASCKNADQRRALRRSTSSSRTIAISSGEQPR